MWSPLYQTTSSQSSVLHPDECDKTRQTSYCGQETSSLDHLQHETWTLVLCESNEIFFSEYDLIETSPTKPHNAAETVEAHRTEQSDEMLPSRRTQMDSLVQPLVAQYLAMGCQSKENSQNESVSSEEKGKDDAATPRCGSRARVSPPGRPHRFHRQGPAHTYHTGKLMMSLGHLTKGASWEELIQACLQSFGEPPKVSRVLPPFSNVRVHLWGVIKQGYRCKDCGMNCHKLCKDQVAFECKKNTKVATDSPTPSSTPVTMGTSEGLEECPFPYPPDDSKDWSPDSPVTSRLRPQRVHSGTQTEGPHLSSAAPDAGRLQPSLLVPTTPTLTSCPSPVPQRKQRHCAKWENRASVVQKPKEPEEESKPSYESLESDNQRLQRANETLRRKLRETEREVEILKTLLKRHALHPVEEDSSS
ncbi:RAS guanyl-releasing protein 1 [Lates japonicus]|uniref:RAS guanyl-releasing protein 1 n=1 Tax=Lates japonicus TaxID=270547 RepID=A0AAD3MWK6_LATJO|nr:RAS guanyl-releasing protein 1 [Lates japonicus]